MDSTTLLQHCQQHMQQYKVRPQKSMGQNFLINPTSVQKIIQHVKKLHFSSLVEIGPGWGSLTHDLQKLHQLKALKHPLVLIELDKTMAHHWQQKKHPQTLPPHQQKKTPPPRNQQQKDQQNQEPQNPGAPNFCLWHEDVLKTDWQRVPPNTCVVSNLPYQVASRVLVDLSLKAPQVQQLVLMFQKEVAQKIMAPTNSQAYCLLSVVAQQVWQVSSVCQLGRGDFYPRPQVASQVLYFKRQAENLPLEYLNFLKTAFSNRRKQLVNNFLLDRAVSKSDFVNQLKQLNLAPSVRAENLSPQQLWQLFQFVDS